VVEVGVAVWICRSHPGRLRLYIFVTALPSHCQQRKSTKEMSKA
jgi:hypothetical protein